MKTKLKLLGGLLALCVMAISARATVVFQDSFNYADGVITNVSAMVWTNHSGAGDLLIVNQQAKISVVGATGDVSAGLTNAPYTSAGTNVVGDSVTALYFKFTVNMSVTNMPTTGGYFIHLKDAGSSNFRARVYAAVTGAANGYYRLGIGNSSGTAVYQDTDLSTNVTYTVVVRYVLATGYATMWINPSSESDAGLTGTDTPSLLNIYTISLRQGTLSGTEYVDDLVVGTSFADVVAGSGPSAPTIVSQPQDVTAFVGANVSFTNAATGTTPIYYQWYYNTNTVLDGQTNAILVVSNITLLSAGTYSVIASNSVGTATSRYALLTVSSTPIPPTITNQPASQSVGLGDSVTFSVVAGGSPTLVYQWKSVKAGVTNNLTGGTGTSYTLSSVTTGDAGAYFVTITNQFGATNSALATLTVNQPTLSTIAAIRATVDPTTYAPSNTTKLFKARGVVTTHNNLTTSANLNFYIQDATAGICVFWSGASLDQLPPAGTLVEVTAPIANFNGLLEFSGVATNTLHSLVVISNDVPLPAAKPLPFDPATIGNPAIMDAYEGSYFVASNVFLDLTSSNFTSVSAGESITNASGQTFLMYINAYTDIPGQPKLAGPVTIYGVLGQYDSSSPYTNGYQFIPSQYADIVGSLVFTNVLSNLTRAGDLATNSFVENPVRIGEKLTLSVIAADPAGGSVTATPLTDGLPASASWAAGAQSGLKVTNTFVISPTLTDAGVSYSIGLHIVTGSTDTTNYWTVYVPTVTEQGIYISEFLANPTTNTALPYFNPLKRSVDTINITTYDQYVELANISTTDVDLYRWSINTSTTQRHLFLQGGTESDGPEELYSSNSVVVYGGPVNYTNAATTTAPNLTVFNESATTGTLTLPTSGRGILILRNKTGGIVDRVVYAGGSLSTNGALTRFPTLSKGFVPQGYVSTNWASAGLQYDGSAWNVPAKVPAGVSNVVITATGGAVSLSFTANPALASTLWQASDISGTFQVVKGLQFPSAAGVFTVTNTAPTGFYFITTQ